MAHVVDPASVVFDQENLIDGVAKHFLRKVFGPEGLPWGTKFSDLEELSVQIGQAISRAMMDRALADQARAVPATAETCGSVARRSKPGPPANPGRHHHGGDGALDRAATLLPRLSGGFFSLSRGGLGLIGGPTAPMSSVRSSTPACRTRHSPPAGTTCSTWRG